MLFEVRGSICICYITVSFFLAAHWTHSFKQSSQPCKVLVKLNVTVMFEPFVFWTPLLFIYLFIYSFKFLKSKSFWPLTFDIVVEARMQSKAIQALIHGCQVALTWHQTLLGLQLTDVFTLGNSQCRHDSLQSSKWHTVTLKSTGPAREPRQLPPLHTYLFFFFSVQVDQIQKKETRRGWNTGWETGDQMTYAQRACIWHFPPHKQVFIKEEWAPRVSLHKHCVSIYSANVDFTLQTQSMKSQTLLCYGWAHVAEQR